MSNTIIQFGQILFVARPVDQYVDITTLCSSAEQHKPLKKRRNVNDWSDLVGTEKFIKIFTDDILGDINRVENTLFRDRLIQSLEGCHLIDDKPIDGITTVLVGKKYPIQIVRSRVKDITITRVGPVRGGGFTWVHPRIAINFAEWISVEFSLQVAKWVERIMFDAIATFKDREIAAERQEHALVKHKNEQLVIANRELAVKEGQLVIVNRELVAIKRENEQLVVLERELALIKQENERFILAGQQMDLIKRENEKLQRRVREILSELPHKVESELKQHVFLICAEKDKVYHLHHCQKVSFRPGKYDMNNIVFIRKNVPCGTKVVDVIRAKLNGGRTKVWYSEIKIAWTEGEPDRPPQPMMFEDELKTIVKQYVDNNLVGY